MKKWKEIVTLDCKPISLPKGEGKIKHLGARMKVSFTSLQTFLRIVHSEMVLPCMIGSPWET